MRLILQRSERSGGDYRKNRGGLVELLHEALGSQG